MGFGPSLRIEGKNMKEFSIDDLLYELKRQFPRGATTFGGCSGKEIGCRGMARGCGYCNMCCKVKLVAKGVSPESVDEYAELVIELRDLHPDGSDLDTREQSSREIEIKNRLNDLRISMNACPA